MTDKCWIDELTRELNTSERTVGGSVATNAGDVLGGAALWEFDDNGTSKAYDDAVQGELESAYLSAGSRHSVVVKLKAGQWNYEVDVVQLVQTNVSHSARTQRQIRRRLLHSRP